MTQMWLVGAVASVTLVGSASAQTPPPQTPPTTQMARPTTPPTTQMQRPTGGTPTDARPTGGQTMGGQTTPRGSMQRAEVPAGETNLGTVTIPRAVTADGKPLAAGRYMLRLTAQTAQPAVAGQIPDLNRWVEFVQGGQVRGREVVSIVPADEVSQTMPGPDMPGRVGRTGSRVEMLKGGEYLRVWVARGGNNYLLHLPPQGAAR